MNALLNFLTNRYLVALVVFLMIVGLVRRFAR